MRLSAPRAAHQREGHERFTLDVILAEEAAVLDLVDARDDRARLWDCDDRDPDTAALSADQARAVRNIAAITVAGAAAVRRRPARARPPRCARCAPPRTAATPSVLVLAPTGKPSTSRCAEAPATRATPSPKPYSCSRQRRAAAAAEHGGRGRRGRHGRHRRPTPPPRRPPPQARVKTVLVGDAHQLAPVKARGGMFDHLCTDLPWTQHLSEVWRMRDPQNATPPSPCATATRPRYAARCACISSHDRLHSGDQIAMATDALPPTAPTSPQGKDALLVCDTKEMADALNQRLHHDTIPADAADRDRWPRSAHRGRGSDLDPPQRPHRRARHQPPESRTPSTWCATATAGASSTSTPNTGRHRRRRLDDDAGACSPGDYLREHVTLGYAGHRALRPRRHHRHHPRRARRHHHPQPALRRHDPRPRHQHRLPLPPPHRTRIPTRPTRLLHRCGAATPMEPPKRSELIASTGEAPVTAHDYATRTAGSALPTTVQHLMQRREMDTHGDWSNTERRNRKRVRWPRIRASPFQACQPQSQRQ